jgi:hypothetical protein
LFFWPYFVCISRSSALLFLLSSHLSLFTQISRLTWSDFFWYRYVFFRYDLFKNQPIPKHTHPTSWMFKCSS